VFFLGDARMEGSIGENKLKWPGTARWSGVLDENERDSLAGELGLVNQLPRDLWLTAFKDISSPRPGTDDLFFAASADQTPVLPPPVVRTSYRSIPVPADVILFLLAGTVGVIWLVRRRRDAAS
jgi:hypothetical protein